MTRLQTQVPPPPVPPGVVVTGAEVVALQTQLGNLQAQLAGMQAEYKSLQRQLERMSGGNPARPVIVQRTADLGMQMAQIDGQIATIQTRLGIKAVPQATTQNPPSLPRRGPDPDMVVGLSFMLAFGVFVPLAIARARRIWKGTPKQLPLQMTDASQARFDRLEQAVDAIAIEVERVSESQRFMTKLMADRADGARPTVGTEPKQALAADGKPVLALGAGPIEPIRVPERQAVRQSITPH